MQQSHALSGQRGPGTQPVPRLSLLDPDPFLQVDGREYAAVVALLGGGAPPDVAGPYDGAVGVGLVDRLLACWRVLPALEAPLRALGDQLPPGQHDRLHRARLVVTAFAKAQWVVTRRLVGALERAEIDYSLLKGSAIGLRAYPQPWRRTASDIDVGVPRSQLRRAEQVARDLGFWPAQKNDKTQRFEPANPALRASVEAQHYELGFMVKRLQATDLDAATTAAIREDAWARRFWIDDISPPWCYVIVDIHHALSHDVRLADLLETRQRASWGDVTANVPDDAWLAMHLILKIYWEGVHTYGKGLYQYADLCRLMQSMSESDFEKLRALVVQHNMVAGAHYTLRRLPLFGTVLPPHVTSFLKSSNAPHRHVDSTAEPFADFTTNAFRLNDLGDMWARLWGQR